VSPENVIEGADVDPTPETIIPVVVILLLPALIAPVVVKGPVETAPEAVIVEAVKFPEAVTPDTFKNPFVVILLVPICKGNFMLILVVSINILSDPFVENPRTSAR
jgi:hypothetical protein